MFDLESIWRRALEICAPDVIVLTHAHTGIPLHVIAIGKCAGAMLDGIASKAALNDALAIVPHGYRAPQSRARLIRGGHPDLTSDSFNAGDILLRFVEQHDNILFLISGGGSACVEKALPPFSVDDLVAVNRALVTAGLPIHEINVVRKHLSAIKGGRLGARVRGRSVSLIYSDVASNAAADVASGPTVPDTSSNAEAAAILERVGGCDRIVTILRDETTPDTVAQIDNSKWQIIADNGTLIAAAVRIAEEGGLRPVVVRDQIEDHVARAAQVLVDEAVQLQPGEILIAGGEPTVRVRGKGRGGRCSELAVRFATEFKTRGSFAALFASSDGVDGNSGVAGIALDSLPAAILPGDTAAALDESDSLRVAAKIGRAVIIPPTGNNLRDLYLVARR